MNIIKSTFRNFKRFKLYTSLNLLGITLGLTCTIVLFLYIAFQLSFDKFHTDKNLIFRVSEKFTTPDNKEVSPAIRFPIAPELKETYPEIENYCRLMVKSKELLLKYNEKNIKINKTINADDSYFNFFTFDLELGAPQNVLKNENAIVLTKKVAEMLFGNQNPVGAEITCDNKKYIVTGIADNVPLNSHIQFDAIMPLKPIIDDPNLYVGWDGGLSVSTFIKLKKGTSKQTIEAKLPALLWEKVNKKDKGTGFFTEFELEPMDKIHLYSNADWDSFPKEEYQSVMTLFLIGVLVLIIALLNYLFITRGILILRLKEFGIKKYLGVSKQGIFSQLAFESFVLFLIAGIFSIILLGLFKPTIIHLFGQDFITFQLIKNLPYLILGLIITSQLTAYLQYLSFNRKVNQLSSTNISNVKFRNKKIAYVTAFQFVVSIVLISSVFLIYKQLNFALNKDLGFKSENILILSHDEVGIKAESLISEMKKIPGVISTSASMGIPGLESSRNGYQAQGSDQWKMYNALHVDDNFFETFNIELVELNPLCGSLFRY